MSKWRKIKSAPMDGEQVLISGYIFDDSTQGRWVFAARWYESEGRWIDDPDSILYPPTHWRPLPKPPAT